LSATDPNPEASPQAQPQHQRSFVSAALTVSALTFLSRITGLLRDAYLASAFGLGGVSDAFKMGFQAPNLFRRLFGEGALTAAFIPIYTDLLRNDPPAAKRFASACLFGAAALLGAITILVEALLLIVLIKPWGEPWTSDTKLAIQLIMLMLPYMPLVCLVALLGSILQVHGRFAPSAGMPVFLNVVMLVGTFAALHMTGGHDDGSLSKATVIVGISVVVAGIVQLFTQGRLLLRHTSLTTDFSDVRKPVREMLVNFLPMLLALAVFQINTFLDSIIAFGLSPKTGGADKLHLLGFVTDFPVESGGMTALTNAQLLYQFPLGVFGLAIATAIFPALSHAAADATDLTRQRFVATLRQGLRLTVFIGLPASVGLLMVRLPLTRVLYERGRFDLEDSLRVAAIVAGFAPAIWAYSMTHVITRAFYALKDSRTPLRVSVAMVVLNLTLNLILVWPLGAAGLAWSTCVCAMLQNVVLLIMLRRYVGHSVDGTVLKGWARTLALSLLVALVLWPITHFYPPQGLSRFAVAVQLTCMVILGATVFLAGAWLTGAQELSWLKRRRSSGSKTSETLAE
jgi:putative peptidoglycan lipid II flippase